MILFLNLLGKGLTQEINRRGGSIWWAPGSVYSTLAALFDMGIVSFILIGMNSFHMKAENQRFPSECLRWRVNCKFGNSVLLFARLRQRNKLKCGLHMHDYFFTMHVRHDYFLCCSWDTIIFYAARATRYFFVPRVALSNSCHSVNRIIKFMALSLPWPMAFLSHPLYCIRDFWFTNYKSFYRSASSCKDNTKICFMLCSSYLFYPVPAYFFTCAVPSPPFLQQ